MSNHGQPEGEPDADPNALDLEHEDSATPEVPPRHGVTLGQLRAAAGGGDDDEAQERLGKIAEQMRQTFSGSAAVQRILGESLRDRPKIDFPTLHTPRPALLDLEMYVDETPAETLRAVEQTAEHTAALVSVMSQLAKAQELAVAQATREHRWNQAGVWISAIAAVAAIVAIIVTVMLAP